MGIIFCMLSQGRSSLLWCKAELLTQKKDYRLEKSSSIRSSTHCLYLDKIKFLSIFLLLYSLIKLIVTFGRNRFCKSKRNLVKAGKLPELISFAVSLLIVTFSFKNPLLSIFIPQKECSSCMSLLLGCLTALSMREEVRSKVHLLPMQVA
jgi:hypothetical protein